jgi:pimeloyl-ACP methyl ester carboxylesterase
LYQPGIGGSIEVVWEVRSYARLLRRLSSFSRVILFDLRGSGLSDPLARWEEPSLEDRAGEMLDVLDAVGSERAAVMANNAGGLRTLFLCRLLPEANIGARAARLLRPAGPSRRLPLGRA